MTEERFNEMVKAFFKALKEKTLLVIVDSASKNEKAVFSIVSFRKKNDGSYGYIDYYPMLKELGFKNYRHECSLFVTYCAGRFSLYILDNIGTELKGHGVRLPRNFYNWIQYQNHI